jgi:uncharacterized protein YkwD
MMAWARSAWRDIKRRRGCYDIDPKIPPACKNACRAVGWGLGMRRERRAAIVVLLALWAVSAGSTGAGAARSSSVTVKPVHGLCSGASLQPTSANLVRVARATLCLIEREREAYHLGLLRANSSLQRIAASQAKDMVVGDYFGDNTPAGGTPWQRITASAYAAGAHSLLAAQNIGWGTEQMATPEGMVAIWMLSPPHREIMLTSGYRDIGVGVAPAAPSSLTEGLPGATYTVEFATRR